MQPLRTENKIRTITIRLGETDYQNLHLMMERHNYKSQSKFIRDSVFNRKASVKPIPYSADGIRAGILHFTQQLNVIGGNLNQYVRRLHFLSEKKRNNGDPVINTKILLDTEEHNKKVIEKILNTQDALLSFVKKALENMESRIATVYSTSDELKNRFIDALEIPIQHEESEPVTLKQYIMTHEDAYTAFTNLLEIILQIDDYSKEFDNNSQNK